MNVLADQIATRRLRWLLDLSVWRGLRSGIWGFADQAIISATSFITIVLLARQLGPAKFGTFVLAYTALLFAHGIQTALFTQPHNVLGATRSGRDYAEYTTATFRAQLSFAVAAAGVITVAGIVLNLMGQTAGRLLMVVACATFTWQIQEYLRRVFYTQGDYRSAFSNDLITYGGQTLGVLFLWHQNQLTASWALFVIAIASLAGSLTGAFRLRAALFTQLKGGVFRDVAMQNWQFGRWLLGGVLASWISGQLYPVLTAGFVGVAATGGLRASQNLVAPTHILIKSLDAMVPSRAARIYKQDGETGLLKYGRAFGLPAFLVMFAYCALLFVFAKPIMIHLLGPTYGQYIWIAQVHAIIYLSIITASVASILLRAAEVTRVLLNAYLASSILVLTIGIWLVYQFGLAGAVIGLVVHQLVVNAVLWRNIFRLRLQAIAQS